MREILIGALILGAATWTAPAIAQQASITQTIAGTRLDIDATGEVTRVPDLAIITAGVTTRSATATAAMQETAAKMARVRSALKAAGIADRDIQTSNVSLNPEYRYADNQPPQLTGYNATNQLTVRFHDLAQTGKILDALVREGANQIDGPNLTIDQPDQALDEARAKAVAVGRARADLYARSLGLRVVRIVSVSESQRSVPIQPLMRMAVAAPAPPAPTNIEPGEQKLQVTLSMTFELQ